MAIEIVQSDIDTIRGHGILTFPHECCGFLLGRPNGAVRRVTELLRAYNDREEEARHNRFLITPEAYMTSEKAARQKGLDVIGFYHSHPNAEARPSQYDIDHAWPWYSYVIVSVKDSSAARMTSWVLKDDRSAFTEEEIVITEKTTHEGVVPCP